MNLYYKILPSKIICRLCKLQWFEGILVDLKDLQTIKLGSSFVNYNLQRERDLSIKFQLGENVAYK